MRKPQQLDGPTRLLRRDTLVSSATLFLVESGLLAAAAVMTSLSTAPDQPDLFGGPGETARKARPIPPSKVLPNMQVDAGHASPVPNDIADDATPFEANFASIGTGTVFRTLGGANGAIFELPTDLAEFSTGWSGNDALPSPHVPGVSGGGGGRSSGSDDSPQPPPPPPPRKINVIVGTDGADAFLGTEDDDVIYGRDGNDVLHGGVGHDRLLGGKGDDRLLGGAGNDVLVGDKGNDEMTGGAGADTFVFQPGFGHDVITDFKAGGDLDLIQVAKSEFANYAALLPHLAQTDHGTVLTLHDGSTLTLQDVALSSLSAKDFRFDI